ncbi:hypothetical protein L4D09_27710 [Photobacterium makurazakiensis]|uniref:hypothetical protein n=1 Tax=Photobacterium TaxID=657 RepID=UPI003D0B0E50
MALSLPSSKSSSFSMVVGHQLYGEMPLKSFVDYCGLQFSTHQIHCQLWLNVASSLVATAGYFVVVVLSNVAVIDLVAIS